MVYRKKEDKLLVNEFLGGYKADDAIMVAIKKIALVRDTKVTIESFSSHWKVIIRSNRSEVYRTEWVQPELNDELYNAVIAFLNWRKL